MNKQQPAIVPDTDHFKALQILDELAANDSVTQRDLSNKLGIALGLVNSYIKNLIAKGFITVKNIPPKRYAYYLTPQGFAEKTRLAYGLLSDYTRIYREAKNNYRLLFQQLEREGVQQVVFAGADEVAEIAYITLQQTGLRLAGVVDMVKAGERFFALTVMPVKVILTMRYDRAVVTSYLRRREIHRALREHEVAERNISMIFLDE